MVHVEKLFFKIYGVCGKIFKKKNCNINCGILPHIVES